VADAFPQSLDTIVAVKDDSAVVAVAADETESRSLLFVFLKAAAAEAV
jgi:hypothetical protein